MFVNRIILHDFKNIAEADVAFSPKVNYIYGSNGAGKTNLLDAIYYLSMTKSYFSSSDQYVYAYGAEETTLCGFYQMDNGTEEKISASVRRGGEKLFRRGAKAYARFSEHIGLLPIVMVSPLDTGLINDAGEERRKYLNFILSQIDRTYLQHIQAYNQLLLQRNRLLKDDRDQALLLETFSGVYEGPEFVFYQRSGEARTLSGDWSVRFTEGGPVRPAMRTVSRLGSWTLYGREYEVFAGTAEYLYRLAPVTQTADAWEIDLGDVRESASVWLDGRCLGTLFEAPWTVRLTQEQAERGGELVVKVSNLMTNRIIDMDRKGKPWKIFYNANIQPRLPVSRDAQGGFTAAGWDIRPSGLLGPVTLTPLSIAE